MLDNHNRVAFAFQTTYDFRQQGDVGEVRTAAACISINLVRGFAAHSTCKLHETSNRYVGRVRGMLASGFSVQAIDLNFQTTLNVV